jgi:MFS family permease
VIRRPGFVLAILAGLNLLNYVDRTVLAAVLPRVSALHEKGGLGLDKTKAGALATAFLIGYFVTSPIFGTLADRAPRLRTRLMTVGVLIWSVATFLSGRADDFWSMLAARALVGVGEASYAAVAPTLIDDMGEVGRSRRLAVFYLAIPVGSALGYVLGGFLETKVGWRGAFQFVGAPGALLALSCLLIFDRGAAAHAKHERPPVLKMLAPLAKQKVYARAVLGYAAQTFALGGFQHWAPTYIEGRHRFDLDRANYVFGAILVVAGFVGTTAGGAWGERVARGLDRESAAKAHVRICAISAMLGAPFAFAAVLAPNAVMFFAFIFVCIVFVFLSASPINAAILESVPIELRGSGMALSTFSIHMLGDLWSPPLVGRIGDQTSMTVAMLLLPTAIAVSGAIWLRREQTAG